MTDTVKVPTFSTSEATCGRWIWTGASALNLTCRWVCGFRSLDDARHAYDLLVEVELLPKMGTHGNYSSKARRLLNEISKLSAQQ